MAKPPARPAAGRTKGPAPKSDPAREARLGAALRVNLRKRKSATRLAGGTRNQTPADEGGDQ